VKKKHGEWDENFSIISGFGPLDSPNKILGGKLNWRFNLTLSLKPLYSLFSLFILTFAVI
jgi:hypothetical protein